MSQRVKTSARTLVLTRWSQPENGHLWKNNRFLHESLLKIWDFFHECEKRRRISHTSGRNPRSSIETSVRTYSFRFEQCLHFGPETRSPRARREGRLCKVCKVGVLIIFVYCCKYGFQSDTIVISRRRSPYSM